ncbi:MAG: VanW family protein [Rhodospirillaceae bacterium]|nr:VanW family protein [Rhodospirillaceae bacterium]
MGNHSPFQPTYRQYIIFWIKSRLLRVKRALRNLSLHRVKRFSFKTFTDQTLLISESISFLWTEMNAAEKFLQAGKVENLRLATRALNGLHIPANQIFSFWRHVGRPSKWRGYRPGRELRQGCIIPTIGGGLCQLSNALYDSALKAGCLILERHQHSQIIPGSLAEQGRDATVFWNYIDLRFFYHHDLYIEIYRICPVQRSVNRSLLRRK